jgi:hypothetical protein
MGSSWSTWVAISCSSTVGRSVAGSAVDNNKNRLAIGSDQRHPVHTAPRRIATSPLALSGHCVICEVPPVPALQVHGGHSPADAGHALVLVRAGDYMPRQSFRRISFQASEADMFHGKQAPTKPKRRRKALPVLGAAGCRYRSRARHPQRRSGASERYADAKRRRESRNQPF